MSHHVRSHVKLSYGIVAINCLLLFLSFRQMEIARDYATDASREATKAALRIKVASDESHDLMKSMKEIHEDISTNFAIRRERPHVAIVDCCNEVPVRSPGFRDPVELRLFEEFDASVHGNVLGMRMRSKYAFIAHVENVGTGQAIGTRVYWEVEKAIQRDGTVTSLENTPLNDHSHPYVMPASVSPRNKSMILHPPAFVFTEGCDRITRVEGTIRITWQDFMGNDYESRQPFTMDAIMNPDHNDKIGKRLSFHFPQSTRPIGK